MALGDLVYRNDVDFLQMDAGGGAFASMRGLTMSTNVRSGTDDPAGPLPPAASNYPTGTIVLGKWGVGIAYTLDGPISISYYGRLAVAIARGSVWSAFYVDSPMNGGVVPTGRIRCNPSSSSANNGGNYEWENEPALEIELSNGAWIALVR